LRLAHGCARAGGAFPPTWSNRPNGNRKDIMQILPRVLRNFF
jgi:hypothetical protein